MTNNTNQNSEQLWVMLADATRARAVTQNAQGEYGTIIEMDSSSAAASTAAKSGSKSSSSSGDSFVQQIARYISENDDRFGRLVLIAPDIVLTELREALLVDSKSANEKIIGTMAQDLTGLSNEALRTHLAEFE